MDLQPNLFEAVPLDAYPYKSLCPNAANETAIIGFYLSNNML